MNHFSICIISYSLISKDARVLRQIRYLSKAYSLSIIGYGKPDPSFSQNNYIKWIVIPRSKRSLRRRLSDLKRIIKYLLIMPDRKKVLEEAIQARADIYLSNNWDTLPVAAEAARVNKSQLVLDIHESISNGGWFYTLLAKRTVRKYKNQIAACTTVVNSIKEEYQILFNLVPTIVRNIPYSATVPSNINKTNPKKIRLIHHGIATPLRSSDLMIEVMGFCDNRYELHLVFINQHAKYVSYLRDLAEKYAPNRIFFHPPFSPENIVKNISEYDIGFFPLPPNTHNYKIALPNKLFDFISAGLAVMIGPSPNMAEIIHQYHCGIVCNSFDPELLANSLNQTSAAEWDSMKQESLKASKDLNSEKEMKKMLSIISDLLTETHAQE